MGKAGTLWKMLPEKYRRRDRNPESAPFAVIADDSGICVDALDGRPGVYSARYGSESISDGERNALLLEEMKGVERRGAHYVCCMVAILGTDHFGVAQETWHGEIAQAPSEGTGGFGYDPIFYLPDRGLTVADIDDAEKDAISHRGKASRRIRRYLNPS